MLSEKAITEFEILWKQDHPGETISHEDLVKIASRLLRAVELIMLDGEDQRDI
jgi:hypothetical protein